MPSPSSALPGTKIRLPPRALENLRRADPALGAVIDRVGPFAMRKGTAGSDFESLCRSIVYQQLSGKAAATIFARVVALYGPEAKDATGFPTPASILQTHHARLRKAGLSRQKQAALKDLCRHVVDRTLPLGELQRLDGEALVERLVAVRGIGRWSAQMFMMFHLGRLDVWPEEDLGIRKGVQRLRGLPELPGKVAMKQEGLRYRPYCTVAAWYLWRSLEGEAQL